MTGESQLQCRKSVSLFTRLFRLLFIVFSLYLMGDAFSRWDGFRMHSSFFDFLPNVGLAFIFWTALSFLATVFIWLMCTVVLFACTRVSRQFKSEHLFINTVLLLALGLLIWAGKKYFFNLVETSAQLKLTVLFITMGVSIVINFLLRDVAVRWADIIHDRITPLVWLFGLLFIILAPLTGYQFFFSESSNGSERHPSPVTGLGKDRPNILLVTFDTLTARDMSLYGYERPTTPFISEWAKKATVFTDNKAESNWTPPTIASLMTGKRVWTHGLFHSIVPKINIVESLPAELKKYGYYNVAFIANQLAHPYRMGISESFDVAPSYAHFVKPTTLIGWTYGALDVYFYRFFGEKYELYNWMIAQDFILGQILYRFSEELSKTPFPPYMVFNSFLEMIDKDLPEPFFAWIHIMPPHDHYIPPEPFMGTFNPSEELRIYPGNLIPAVRDDKFLSANVDLLRDRYDEFILYCDKQFEKFMQSLEERQLKNTLIVLSSDHGESFEHEYYSHGGKHLYEQVTHVPLIIQEPGQNEGKVINVLSEQVDIPATMLDIIGLQVPQWMEGRSLLPAIRGEHLDPRPAFSMNFDSSKYGEEITSGTIAVWDGDYKLIYFLEEEKNLLFNLREDRDELDNLYEKQPKLGRHLLGLILENLEKANERIRNQSK